MGRVRSVRSGRDGRCDAARIADRDTRKVTTMPKCPHCPAEYSTQEEVDRHYHSAWEHLRERLAETQSALNEAARQHGEARLLVDAATCFAFGDFYAEHLVDTDGNDHGWVVSKNGKWEQREGLSREQAIEQARARWMAESVAT